MENYKNFNEYIEQTCSKYADRIAFRIKSTPYTDITYRQMQEDINALTSYFIAHDLKRVAVIGRNSYEWFVVFLSALYSGGIIVPLDRGLFSAEIDNQLSRSEADAVFYTDDLSSIFEEKNNIFKCCVNSEEYTSILQFGRDNYVKPPIGDPNKTSILVFTSGTTSDAKAVELSQSNILSDAYSMAIWENFYSTDVNLAILPFHHTFGMVQMILFTGFGMCHVFAQGLRIAKALVEYKVTILVGVPRIIEEMHKTIIRKLTKAKKANTVRTLMKVTNTLCKLKFDIRRKTYKEIIDAMGGNLRFIIIGAAAPNPESLKFFNSLGILTVQGYGLTETSPCIAAENDDNMRLGSVGKAIPGANIVIDSPNENGIGEITVQGSMVMRGYYKNTQATESVMKNGFFHTGDMGYLDKDGFLFITGRKKNIIVLSNGKNVFPEELEFLVSNHELVKECLVDSCTKNGKEFIRVTVVCEDINSDSSAIKQHIANVCEKLPNYKKIDIIEFTENEFEKTTTLKIKRNKNVSN